MGASSWEEPVDYGHALAFGVNLDPNVSAIEAQLELALAADVLDLEVVCAQDHPYQPRHVDALALLGAALGRTRWVRAFPNVVNLPLRHPALLATQIASLDRLYGGRVELGIGAGAFPDRIAAMGGPRRSPGESVDALAEGVELLRQAWSGAGPVTFEGAHYRVRDWYPGPAPAHPIAIVVGALKPRMLELTGRLADGWVVSTPYLSAEQAPASQARIDAAALAAGREPAAIRRILNVMGEIADGDERGTFDGPPAAWIETLTRYATDLGFDTFLFWPRAQTVAQVERFAREVVPAVREAVARTRADRPG